jgi:hypothetical protein
LHAGEISASNWARVAKNGSSSPVNIKKHKK